MATVLHASPAFADVISGATERPTEFEGGYGTFARVANHRKFWWWWATRTHAVQTLASALNLALNPQHPSDKLDEPKRPNEHFSYRSWQPWIDRGTDARGHGWEAELIELRRALGDDRAGVLFTERSSGCYGIDQAQICSERYLIAVNDDGTRCAYVRVNDHTFSP